MAGIIGWIKNKTANVLDPDRPARIEKAARDIEQMLVQKRDAFDARSALEIVIAYPDEFPAILRRTYEIYATRAWREDGVSEKERASLQWIAGKLGLPASDADAVDRACGTQAFANAFRAAIADGRLDDAELQTLKRITESLNTDAATLLTSAFRHETGRLFDDLFHAALPGGRVDEAAWERLTRTLAALGVGLPTFRVMVSSRARSIIESALAEATDDDAVTDDEARRINWLLEHLVAEDAAYARYVVDRVHRVRHLQRIRAGHLPSVAAGIAGVRAGEITHATLDSTYVRTRNTKAGPAQDRFAGRLIITDTRLLFVGDTLTLDVPHRRVADVRIGGPWVTLQCSGKGSGAYALGGDPEVVGLIYDVAIRRGNQTVVQSVDGLPSRHIPRDVRQRVWQTYGGKCAECGATSYLEFDHIIAVAKGGSSTEQNVQLLCRGCNGKKSDRI